MRKQIISMALCGLMVLGCGTQALAATPNVTTPSTVSFSISPRMSYIAQANGMLYIDANGIATVECSVYGYQDTTTRVEITANLQRYSGGKWSTIKTFTAEKDSHRTELSEEYKISKGYSYRVKATIKAYGGSASEIQTVTSSEAYY